jgi:hydrogenase maturation protease
MKEYKTLIYAYGNPGRMDDGLGCRFVNELSDWIDKKGIKNIEFDCNYQLNIEEAHKISEKDLVIFVDASQENIEDYLLTKVDKSSKISFTSHEASPGYIYYLCRELFGKNPATYLLHIKGYDWTFKEGLSDNAKKNLNASLEYIKKKIQNIEELITSFHDTKLN